MITTENIIGGGIFDIYALKDKMILWIKERNGNVKRLEHPWTPSIYVASYFKSDLKLLIQDNQILSFIKEHSFVEKYENPGDNEKKEILKLTLNDSFQIFKLAKNIEKHCEKFCQYRLYNVDIVKEQSYIYEHDIYPIGIYDIEKKYRRKNDFTLEWILNNDNIHSFDYTIPNFKTLSFKIISKKKESLWKSFDYKIQSFTIKTNEEEKEEDSVDGEEKEAHNKEEIEISKNDETETIFEFFSEIKKIDPDIILTSNGDKILFPYLFIGQRLIIL
jgi:DNA polymerase I